MRAAAGTAGPMSGDNKSRFPIANIAPLKAANLLLLVNESSIKNLSLD